MNHLLTERQPTTEKLDQCFRCEHKLDARFISTVRPLKDVMQQPFWCRCSPKLLVLPANKKGTHTCRLTGIQCENPFTKSVYFPCDSCAVEGVSICPVDGETSVVGHFLSDRCILYLVDASASKPNPFNSHMLSFETNLEHRVGTVLTAVDVCRVYSSLGNTVAYSDSPLQLPCSRIIDIAATLKGVAVLTDNGLALSDLNLSLKCHLSRSDINSIAFVTDRILAIATPSQLFFLNINDSLTPLYFLSLPQSTSKWTIHSSANSFFTLTSANRVVIGKMDGRTDPKAIQLVNSEPLYCSNPVLFGSDLDFCFVAFNKEHRIYTLSNVHFTSFHFDSRNPLQQQSLPQVGPIHISLSPVQPTPVVNGKPKVHEDKASLQICPFKPTLLCDRFLQCQQEELLTDSVIVFHGKRFSCHSSYLASFSKVLRTKFNTSSTEVVFPELEASVSDPDHFFQVFQYFYGHPMHLTVQNVGHVLSLCSSLQLELFSQSILETMTKWSDRSKPFQLQLDSNEIVTRMCSTLQRDVVLTYLDDEIVISSIF
ncbi:hypothetical protein GEMRC1_005705 [Eukaryota sp. GEM-RC1]